MALVTLAGLAAPLAPRAAASATPADDLLPVTRLLPVEYVLQKLERHRIVLLGEGHWIRHDAELVAALVPRLAEARVVLAMETLEAPDQDAIDRRLAAPEWDEAASMRPLHTASWPYREYQEILRADLSGHAKAIVDRAGNILRRRFGEQVFLVTLHKPVWCGKEPWDYCLPLDGAIDCAAVSLGPVGFDVAGQPVGDRVVDPAVYYAHGYPSLRLGEMTDGYVWSRPIEKYEDVRLIPLDEFAPDEAALREVAANNPFSDEKEMTRAQIAELWRAEEAKREDPLTSRRWRHLVGWRSLCGGVARSEAGE
jgi:hypothetical protein